MASYKIYLSSTFRDLELYRKAILDLLGYFREQLPVNAMEVYIAEDVGTLEKCIADVGKCDIYILMIGNRYGFIPENNALNQNPDRKSITHLEFEAARSTKKTTWVYLADLLKAKEGTFPEDPEDADKPYKRKMLQAFKDEASKQLPVPFIEPIDLTRAVAASIIKKTMADPDIDSKYIDPNWKHCCNRSEQFNKYEQNRINKLSHFQLFVGCGYEADIPSNFTIRCAIFSLHIPEEYIISISFCEFYEDDSLAANIQNFIFRLHKKLEPNKDIQSSSEEELKKAICNNTLDNIVIKTLCEEENLDEKRIECMTAIFQILHNVCIPAEAEIPQRIYYFFYIQDDIARPERLAETNRKIDLMNQQSAALNINAIFFKRFGTLNKEHIRTWITNYFTNDDYKIQLLYSANFKDLTGEFRMQDAEAKIRQFFQKIKKKDDNILNILNS